MFHQPPSHWNDSPVLYCTVVVCSLYNGRCSSHHRKPIILVPIPCSHMETLLSFSHPCSRSDAEKMSLAEWAKQLGCSDMLSALKERTQGQCVAPGGIGKEENQGPKGVVETEGGERSREGVDSGHTEAGGKGMATDHAGMFVEELRVRSEFLSSH